MSDLNAIGIILAALITTTYGAIWAVDRVGTRSTEVVTGIAQGVPISKKHRWMLTFNVFFPMGASVGLLTLLNAVAMYQVANAVGESSVRWLAYVAALYQGVSSLQWLGGGILFILYFKSVLDETRRD